MKVVGLQQVFPETSYLITKQVSNLGIQKAKFE